MVLPRLICSLCIPAHLEPLGCSSTHSEIEEHLSFIPFSVIPLRPYFVSCTAILSRYFFSHLSLRFSVGPLSLSPFLLPHPPHGALVQLGIITVLGLCTTEHVCEAGAAVQVTEKVGFEVEHFQVDIHLICHAL